MKQFNLKEYLVNPSRKVITRDGLPVRIICTNRTGTENDPTRCVVGLVHTEYGYESVMIFDKNGRWCAGKESKCDLFFAPKRQSRWVCLYPGFCGVLRSSEPFDIKEEAKRFMAEKEGFALTEITWEE